MIDSKIFGQWPWKKPPRGKPVREREILLFLQDKKSDIHFYSQKIQLISTQKFDQQTVLVFVLLLPRFLCKPPWKMCQKYQQKSALENCASTLRICTIWTAFNAAVRPRFLCQKKPECCLEKKNACYSPRKCAEKYSPYGPHFLCCTACVRPRNSCRVRTVINAVLVFCALLDIDFCALQTLLYDCLENRALLSSSALSFSSLFSQE